MASAPDVADRRRLRLRRWSSTRKDDTAALCVFFAFVLAFYSWVVLTSEPVSFDVLRSGPHGLLGDAFAHGQLNLRFDPPAGLLALHNPYDPAANMPFRRTGLHDLTLWHSKLYIYWGPVPALLLFAPLRLVGVWLPQSLATLLFGFGGTVFSALTLRFLVRRFLPSTPAWALWAGMTALALSNVVPFSLRRPSQYELAIEGALCFGFLGLWLLLTAWFGGRPPLRRLAGASLAFGLAIGCRPTGAAYLLVPLVLVLGARRSGAWPRANGVLRSRLLLALIGPLAVCGALLAAYDLARFGNPLELGQRYQLSAFDQTHRGIGHLSYLLPGLFYYLVMPPQPLAAFPFLDLGPPPAYPWHLPAGYTGVETTGGLLPLVPAVLVLALLPWVARRWEPDLRRIAGAMLAAGALTLVALSVTVWGTTQRYEVDFVSLLLIAALLVWYAVLARPRRTPWPRRLAIGTGVAALTWGSLAGLAESITGYNNVLAVNHPNVYRRFVDAFSPLSQLIAVAAGGPVIARISSPIAERTDHPWPSPGPHEVAFDVSSAPVVLTIASPARRHYALRLAVAPGQDAQAGEGAQLLVGLEAQAPQTLAVRRPAVADVDLALGAGINRVVVSATAVRARGARVVAVRGLAIVTPGTPLSRPPSP
ncbi:MAG: hypothetical protein QOC54_2216 [Baekduia sp.]|nr:hypothetical protein [Baekduia sp.]